jgi:hypothetical protein
MIQEEGFLLLLLLLGQLLLLRRRRRRGAAMAGVGATHATPGVYVAELMIPVASAGRQRHASSRARAAWSIPAWEFAWFGPACIREIPVAFICDPVSVQQ